jgi:hypothetical protein
MARGATTRSQRAPKASQSQPSQSQRPKRASRRDAEPDEEPDEEMGDDDEDDGPGEATQAKSAESVRLFSLFLKLIACHILNVFLLCRMLIEKPMTLCG